MEELLHALEVPSNSDASGKKGRDAFRRYAEARDCAFDVDADGSVKIRRSGGDNDLSDITIIFNRGSSVSLESTISVFSALGKDPLPSGIVLIEVGVDTGQSGDIEIPPKQPDFRSEMNQLRGAVLASSSAVFSILQADEGPLRLEGSSLLISRARKYCSASASLETAVAKGLKTPCLRIYGPSAQQVAVDTISDYSKYIAALFENFD